MRDDMDDESFDLLGNVSIAEPTLGIQVGTGVLKTHGPGQCSGEFCSIHNPSDHPLKDSPFNWRADRGLLERVCDHGVGHPDPDGLAHLARLKGKEFASVESVHGCDGCC